MEQEISRRDATDRDVAVSVELVQRYIEILEEMETADLQIDTSVTVAVDGKAVRFQSDEGFETWLTSVLNQ